MELKSGFHWKSFFSQVKPRLPTGTLTVANILYSLFNIWPIWPKMMTVNLGRTVSRVSEFQVGLWYSLAWCAGLQFGCGFVGPEVGAHLENRTHTQTHFTVYSYIFVFLHGFLLWGTFLLRDDVLRPAPPFLLFFIFFYFNPRCKSMR